MEIDDGYRILYQRENKTRNLANWSHHECILSMRKSIVNYILQVSVLPILI